MSYAKDSMERDGALISAFSEDRNTFIAKRLIFTTSSALQVLVVLAKRLELY